ncbi:DUF748 domain-containing protein [Geobacter sp.]|uniref:DUF748 domain-containing protein n=1 Tax=Geobacter sp. TaxID=46610 RepID=UPI0027BA8D68|nr:DUF748 domain-containing protein [Geobacter sp.]
MDNGKASFLSKALRLAPKVLCWFAGTLVLLVVALFIASFFLDEPLRSSMEKKMNHHLKGYSVRLPGLHFQLVGLSMTLKGLTVTQQAHPDTPVARFPMLHVSIHWREIFAGRLVSELSLDRPEVHINLKQLRSEVASKVPFKDRGWQEAIEAIYPLKINKLEVTDGNLVYIDQDPKRPLRLSHLFLQASNIRNIHFPEKVYPSSFHLETVVFDTGRAVVDGKANFLAQPHPGINARFTAEKVPLDYFRPVIARSNLSIRNGILFASGETEYAPQVKVAHVHNLTIQGMELDYIHSPRTAAAEKRRVEKVKKAASEVAGKPGILLRLDQLALSNCNLGFVNKSASPAYRVFLADTALTLSNLSNKFLQGPAKVKINGKFMGSGSTQATASFRPEKDGPDFDVHVKIENTRLTSMNDLFRAYGKFDVSEGTFSFYSDLQVRNNVITGYVKPFFKDVKVYDKRTDKEKSLFRRMYEMLVGGIATLLERSPREVVATKADISGRVENPQVSTWQIVAGLVRNAFFKAILPGFEKEVSRAQRR